MTAKVQTIVNPIDDTQTWCESYKQGNTWVIECHGMMLNGISITKRSYLNHTASENTVGFESERLLKQIEDIVLAANYVHEEDALGLMQHFFNGESLGYSGSFRHRLEKTVIPKLKQRILDTEISTSALYGHIRKVLVEAIQEHQYVSSGGLNKLSPSSGRL